VSLQRQNRHGRWGFYKRGRLSTPIEGGSHSRYRMPAISRHSRRIRYRVVVIARDGGAHYPGTSRTYTMPKR
jgi:hypothetical protein